MVGNSMKSTNFSSVAMNARNNDNIFKVMGRNVDLEIYIQWKHPSKMMENYRQFQSKSKQTNKKAARIDCQQCFRNVERISSGWRTASLDRNSYKRNRLSSETRNLVHQGSSKPWPVSRIQPANYLCRVWLEESHTDSYHLWSLMCYNSRIELWQRSYRRNCQVLS